MASKQLGKPEYALKRAEELYNSNNPNGKSEACEFLYQVITSKKYRQWSKALENLMKRFLEICVELRRGKHAKDGLHQYRALSQQHLSSLEVVLKHFLDRAKEATKDAQVKAEGMALEIEDLDLEEASAEHLLMAVSGEDSKDRADRELVTPWLKFLWETYRTILEILRNNIKLEMLYKETTQQAFVFCQKYRRINEFRRLSDLLRNHLANLIKIKPLDSAESLQFQLDIRFAQLNTAIALELWQEAYHTIEDIHGVIITSKVQPPPQLMANFYEKLAQIFWVSQYYLFHANALYKFYEITREIKKDISKEELEQLSSRVLLAALSIPPQRDEDKDNEYTIEFDVQRERNIRIAPLLGNPIERRDLLFEELVEKEIPNQVVPELRDLFVTMEQTFQPLELTTFLKTKLQFISTVPVFKQYTESLRRVGVIKILQQLSQVYQKMELKQLNKLLDFLSPNEVEDNLINAIAEHYIEARVDHKRGVVIFQPSSLQSDHSRLKLVQIAKNLARLVQLVEPAEKKIERAAFRQKLYAKVLATLEEEHKKILGRRLIIEQIKEIREKQELENQKRLEQEELQRQRMIAEKPKETVLKQVEQQQEPKQKEQIKKDMEKEEAKSTPQRVAASQKTGKAATVDKNKLDENSVVHVQSQNKQLAGEREKMIQKIQELALRMDHMVRARREVEIPLLQQRWEQIQVEQQKEWEGFLKLFYEQHKKQWELQFARKQRLARMTEDRKRFEEAAMKKRQAEYEKALKEREEKLRQWREAHKKPELTVAETSIKESALPPSEGKVPQPAQNSAETAPTKPRISEDKVAVQPPYEELEAERVTPPEKTQKPSKAPSSEKQEIKPSEVKTVDQQPPKSASLSKGSDQKRIERDSGKGPIESSWRTAKKTPTEIPKPVEQSNCVPNPSRPPTKEPSAADRATNWRKQPSHPSSEKTPEKPTEPSSASRPSSEKTPEKPAEPSSTSRPSSDKTPEKPVDTQQVRESKEVTSTKLTTRFLEPKEAMPREKYVPPRLRSVTPEGDWRSKKPPVGETRPELESSQRPPPSNPPSRSVSAADSAESWRRSETRTTSTTATSQPPQQFPAKTQTSDSFKTSQRHEERSVRKENVEDKGSWRKEKPSGPSSVSSTTTTTTTTTATTNTNTATSNTQKDIDTNEQDGEWETVPSRKKN